MKFLSSFSSFLVCACATCAATSDDGESVSSIDPIERLDDYIIETSPTTLDRKAPAVTQQVLASDLAALNLTSTVSALRNFPNVFIRERFIGDKNALMGIRGTTNRQPGRSLVYADGELLSNFLGTGFGNSPRWFLVAPEELEKIAVIYGPFSALYPGNSIGGTVLLTTRMPEHFTASAKGQWFYHNFREYGTNDSLRGSTAFVSIGDKPGAWSYYGFYSHLNNDSAPTQFGTLNYSQSSSLTPGVPRVSGGISDTDFSSNQRLVFGSEGPTHAVHDLFKLKLGYDVSSDTRLRFTATYWTNLENREAPETYLRDSTGAPVWSGRVEFDHRTLTIPASSVLGLSRRNSADLINAFTFVHAPQSGLQIAASGNLYDTLRDKTYASATDVSSARAGGPGQATIVGRTGWQNFDLKFGYAADDGPLRRHAFAFGGHLDHFFTKQAQYNLTNWLDQSTRSGLLNGNGGATRTYAWFAQDVWTFTNNWSLTPGVRWENWRADDGYRERDLTNGTRAHIVYPVRTKSTLSPKLAWAWRWSPGWNARLSLAEAYRFPTAGELFQGSISANGSVTNNDPTLRPERALDADLTIEHTFATGFARLSFFQEEVRRALVSQSFPLPDGTSFSGIQNIGLTRTRGVEASFDHKGLFVDTLDVYLGLSYTDAKIVRNPELPSSEGKQVPRIPYWQTRAGVTWRVLPPLSFNAQLRTASRQFNTLDNSDPRGGYGGVDNYHVIDVKATYVVRHDLSLSLGCDNIGDFRYHVFHPMEERTFFAEANWRY